MIRRKATRHLHLACPPVAGYEYRSSTWAHVHPLRSVEEHNRIKIIRAWLLRPWRSKVGIIAEEKGHKTPENESHQKEKDRGATRIQKAIDMKVWSHQSYVQSGKVSTAFIGKSAHHPSWSMKKGHECCRTPKNAQCSFCQGKITSCARPFWASIEGHKFSWIEWRNRLRSQLCQE